MAQQEEQTPAQKLEHDLSELESRLERLRVLFEQYFMGIEKRQPGVQRTDVERRIAALRKVRINSTAKRFKFQTMVQRYNTLSNYWNRTCREIENGTYHRHVKQAERRRLLEEEQRPNPTQEEVQERAASAADAKAEAQADLAAMLDGDLDLDAEMNDALSALDAAPSKTASKSSVQASGLGSLGKSKGMRRSHTQPTLHLGKAPEIKSKDSDDTKRSAKSPRASLKPKGLEPLKKRSATGDRRPGADTASKRSATAPKRSATANPLAGLGKKPPPKPETGAQKPTPPKRTATGGGPPPAPSMRPRPAAKTAVASPKKPAPPAKKPAAAAKSGSGLSSDRIAALHASYADARKKTNATAVSYDKLEKNIRETEKRLRAKHKGKAVDFEVGIKNGKAILKPKLK